MFTFNDIQSFAEQPILIELMITRYCCYYCEHCMYSCGPQESKEYMSDEVLAKVKKQVDFLIQLDMRVYINLVGGEPTINFDKFSHILKEVRTWNIPISMSTNGWWFFSEKNIERFFEIVTPCASKDGKSHWRDDYKYSDAFTIRISDDPFHKKSRNTKNVSEILYNIFNNEELVKKI